MTEPLLLSVSQVATYDGPRLLTKASGVFFERGTRLFLVTSRHVLIDHPSAHHPDRIEIERAALPWKLLGVHSARMDTGSFGTVADGGGGERESNPPGNA